MSSSIWLLLFTSVAINLVRCEVCTFGTSNRGCITTEDWRQNILCRIDGGTDNGNPLNDGYMKDTVERPYDRPAQRTCRQAGKTGLESIKNSLKDTFDQDPAKLQEELGLLQAAENSLMNVGRTMYGTIGWRRFSCSLVNIEGTSTSTVVPCGDRRFGRPKCPVIKAQVSKSPTNDKNDDLPPLEPIDDDDLDNDQDGKD